MKTSEKFTMVDAVIIATGITEKEFSLYVQKRQSVVSTDAISCIFPIVYKNGTDFEILPDFVPARKDEVWGYELLPGVLLAKSLFPHQRPHKIITLGDYLKVRLP